MTVFLGHGSFTHCFAALFGLTQRNDDFQMEFRTWKKYFEEKN